MLTAESLAADGLPAVPELAGAAGVQAAAAANGGGADLPQRFRGVTLLRRPGEGLDKAGELMRASQQAALQAQQAEQGAATLQTKGVWVPGAAAGRRLQPALDAA